MDMNLLVSHLNPWSVMISVSLTQRI